MIQLTYVVVSITATTGTVSPVHAQMSGPLAGGFAPRLSGQSQELRQVNLVPQDRVEASAPPDMLTFGDVRPLRDTIASSIELIVTDPARFDDYKLGDEVTVTIGGRDG